MASKEREYINKMRRQYRSPIEWLKDVETRYGADAEQKLSYKEAQDIYSESIGWAIWNDIAMQDFWAEECGYGHQWNEDNPKPIIQKVLATLNTMADHLRRGRELGLSEMEQQVVDTLWGWVPHNYEDNYVSEEGYALYYNKVLREVKKLAEKHDVDFDTSGYNLSVGYLYEWLSNEYGLVSEDACDWEE